MSGALLTDLYELHMAISYLRRGMIGPATFSLFVRHLPPDRGFLIAAGLEDALDHLESLNFTDDEIEAAKALTGMTDSDAAALRGLRFTGDVWAVPEGRVVLAGEPLLEVTAPLPEAQLVETILLNQLTYQTAIASKAARAVLAAEGRPVFDFAFRRTHGVEAAMAVARTTAIAGFAGTSNVEAAHRFGLPAVGTMAHAYIEAFPDERAAFAAFAADFPGRSTFLVDTYDTPGGIDNAISVITERHLEAPLAVRLDSGDLVALSRAARARLDAAGLADCRIVLSGGLDEFVIDDLLAGGAVADAFGVGTRIGVASDAPALDSAYKLVEYDGRPVAKVSAGKASVPGRKQVLASPGRDGDVIALRDEAFSSGEPVLVQVMAGGRRTGPAGTIAAARARSEDDLARLPDAARRIRDPAALEAALSPALSALTDTVHAALTR